MTSANPSGTPVLASIQLLRAYAALSVLIGHVLEELAFVNAFDLPFSTAPLLAGVDVFFVISGFIMYYTSRHLYGVPGGIREFAYKRMTRLVPLYWFFTTLMVLALIFAGESINSAELDWSNIVASYLFFPHPRPSGQVVPILSVGWTLNYEMFFYALFALSLLFPRCAGIAALLGFLVLFVVLGATVPTDTPPLRFWTRNIILEFAYGVLLGVAFYRLPRSVLLSAGAAIVGLVLLYALPHILVEGQGRPYHRGLPAALIVLGALMLPAEWDRKIPKVLLVLGASSFALYLSHRFVLRVVTVIFNRLEIAGSLGIALHFVVAISLSVLTSVAVYYFIEVPTTRWFRRPGAVRNTAPI